MNPKPVDPMPTILPSKPLRQAPQIGHLSINVVRWSKVCYSEHFLERRGLKPRTLFFQKSPVTFLRSASALERLLVLCDATLYIVNASDLSSLNLTSSPKFKGVNACCVNENPHSDDPFSVQVNSKRKLLNQSVMKKTLGEWWWCKWQSGVVVSRRPDFESTRSLSLYIHLVARS